MEWTLPWTVAMCRLGKWSCRVDAPGGYSCTTGGTLGHSESADAGGGAFTEGVGWVESSMRWNEAGPEVGCVPLCCHRFQWSAANFAPDFSISPTEGYISPGMEVSWAKASSCCSCSWLGHTGHMGTHHR